MAAMGCDGIGCDRQEPAPGRDTGRDGSEHRGWLELGFDGEKHRFCSFECLASFANDRLLAIAGD
jgi:hypothetical protein